MQKIISVLLMVLVFSCTKTATGPHAIQKEIDAFLTETAPNRSVGEKGHQAAFEFLKIRFEEIAKKLGGTVRVHEFNPDIGFAIKNYESDFREMVVKKFPPTDPTYLKWKSFTDRAILFVKSYEAKKGRNLILDIPADAKSAAGSNEVLYVGAHYDTITHNHETMEFTPHGVAPGADDNASAIAALLQIARSLPREGRSKTIRFVAFDYEEIFFLGSYALGKDIAGKAIPWADRSEKTVGLINLEMLGWTSKKLSEKPVVKLYTRVAETPDMSLDLVLAKAIEKSVTEKNLSLTPVIVQNGFNRSDNWSFWQNNLPSVCVSQDWESDFNEKNYHTDRDRADTIRVDYIDQIVQAVSSAILKI